MGEEDAQEPAREFNPATDTPQNLDQMKIWIESLGIREGTQTYATMMREAMTAWNSKGFQELGRENDTRGMQGEGEK